MKYNIKKRYQQLTLRAQGVIRSLAEELDLYLFTSNIKMITQRLGYLFESYSLIEFRNLIESIINPETTELEFRALVESRIRLQGLSTELKMERGEVILASAMELRSLFNKDESYLLQKVKDVSLDDGAQKKEFLNKYAKVAQKILVRHVEDLRDEINDYIIYQSMKKKGTVFRITKSAKPKKKHEVEAKSILADSDDMKKKEHTTVRFKV